MARSTSAFVSCLSRPFGPTISSVDLPASNSSNAVSSFVLSSMRSPNIAENAAYTKFRKPSAQGCRAARRALSAAQQSHERRPGGAVDTLRAIDADRECVSIVEKRTRYPAHLSSTRTPRRCACAHRISCLLFAGDAEEPADDSCARFDAVISLGKALHDSNGGCVDPHARRTYPGAAAPHTA